MQIVTGINSPMLENSSSYMPPDFVEGIGRYPEALELVEQAHKEQQYWVSVYNRAQQFGLQGYTVQETILQLQKVGQRLNNLKQLLVPPTKDHLVKFNYKSNAEIANPIKDA